MAKTKTTSDGGARKDARRLLDDAVRDLAEAAGEQARFEAVANDRIVARLGFVATMPDSEAAHEARTLAIMREELSLPADGVSIVDDEESGRRVLKLDVTWSRAELEKRTDACVGLAKRLSSDLNFVSMLTGDVALSKRFTKASRVAYGLFMAMLLDEEGDGEPLRALQSAANAAGSKWRFDLFVPTKDVLGEPRARTQVELGLRRFVAARLASGASLRDVVRDGSSYLLGSTNAVVADPRHAALTQRVSSIVAKLDTDGKSAKRNDAYAIARAIMREFGMKASRAEYMKKRRAAKRRERRV